jgi:hypothetical protein
MGRFATPDWSATPVPVPYADLGNPQSLNLYSYVQNNPITGVDPDGHFCLRVGMGEKSAKELMDAAGREMELQVQKDQAEKDKQTQNRTGTVNILGQTVPYTIGPMGQQQATAALGTLQKIVAAITALRTN